MNATLARPRNAPRNLRSGLPHRRHRNSLRLNFCSCCLTMLCGLGVLVWQELTLEMSSGTTRSMGNKSALARAELINASSSVTQKVDCVEGKVETTVFVTIKL